MAQDFSRAAEGFRFTFGGVDLNSPPDALAPEKFASAINVRGYGDNSTRTRPGQALKFSAGARNILAICAYTPIVDPNITALPSPPRYLAIDGDGRVWLDNSLSVGTLGGGAGNATVGASMIPFRPNQSPSPFQYVASASDYQKFSSPAPSTSIVTQRNVGMAEPQSAPDAAPVPQAFTPLVAPGGQWTAGGTAAGTWVPVVRSTDIVVIALADPANSTRLSIRVASSVPYQRGELVNIGTSTNGINTILEEVLPPLAVSMTVRSIFYFAGSNGRCIVVPQGVNFSSSSPVPEGAPASGVNLSEQNVLATLQRGSLIQIGTETCYVWSVIPGPNQQIAIETSTNLTHIVGETVQGVPTVIVNGLTTAQATPGMIILGDPTNTESFTATVGTGTLTMGATGGTGTVVARPTTLLNGWGPNAHVGAYEGGINQGFAFQTDPSATGAYANPGNAFDGNLATAATAAFAHTHSYAGCVWAFPAIGPGTSGLALNINSQVPTTTSGGGAITLRSACLFYSLDGGITWIMIYNQAVPRAQQWDTMLLPSGQDTSKVQVMAFLDSHDDFAHSVFEINITSSPTNPSIGAGTGVYSDDDYIHFSVLFDNPLNFTQLQLQIDVDDGSFQRNYFYASVYPSQVIPASANTVTQIGVVQSILQQQQVIDETRGTGLTTSVASVAGANQWTEIWLPVSGLTRVGGDQTKTLATIVGIQFLVNASATVKVQVSSLAFVGGGAPNVAEAGAPFRYRIRPRDSRTGVLGNPSPPTRYGTNSRRQANNVLLPAAVYDPQIDTWDVFRYGGAITSWRRMGSVPAGTARFLDNYDDAAAEAGDALDFDNFEPWPTIGIPVTGATATVTGTILTNLSLSSLYGRLLPGNLIQIGGQNVYTLRSRPVNTGGNIFQMEIEENAGSGTSVPITIYEPALADQPLPYLWGTDVDGTMFGCGDPFRPGTLYFSKNNNPDSAPDKYNIEIVQPGEPLLGGEILDGLSFVGSTERWWALFPNPGNPAQRYNFVQQPWARGLGAPYGHCNDGQSIYWWAKDGIYSSRKGSLTDENLLILFPHDGLPGTALTYNNQTYQPPDYSRAAAFRLAYAQGMLYATYMDSTGAYHNMVCELSRGAWSFDDYTPDVTVFYHPASAAGTLLAPSVLTPAVYNDLLMGVVSTGSGIFLTPARVAAQRDLTNDLGGPITSVLATREYAKGDVRADAQWGDIYMDLTPGSFSGVLLEAMSFGQALASRIISQINTRTQIPVDVPPDLFAKFLGVQLTWIDDYTKQPSVTQIFVWQPSLIPKPETTILRVTDWDDAGHNGAKWMQGFVLHADTFGLQKTVTVQEADSPLTAHPFTPVIQHSGESEKAYSFNQPFIAHMVRLVPTTDGNPWRLWKVKWIAEPTPENAETWATQPSTHGLQGFLHVRQISLTYAATGVGAMTLTVTSYDGQSPQPISLPPTAGAVVKVVLPLTANKGQLFSYALTSNAGASARVFVDKSEVLVGQWGREDSYVNRPLVGGDGGDKAEV